MQPFLNVSVALSAWYTISAESRKFHTSCIRARITTRISVNFGPNRMALLWENHHRWAGLSNYLAFAISSALSDGGAILAKMTMKVTQGHDAE